MQRHAIVVPDTASTACTGAIDPAPVGRETKGARELLLYVVDGTGKKNHKKMSWQILQGGRNGVRGEKKKKRKKKMWYILS